MVRVLRMVSLAFLLGFGLPLGAHALLRWNDIDSAGGWGSADWSSTGTLTPAAEAPEARVLVYAARVGRWRSIFAVHSWIVLKEAGASAYDRYDVVGWGGSSVRHNMRPPDARWYGNEPRLVISLSGPQAEQAIPKLRAAIAAYPYARATDYRAWPGPNSNTFVAHVLAQAPEIAAVLPPTAIGKDYPVDGGWFGLAPSRTGLRVTLGGYAGLTLAWIEGIEINLFGGILGLDLRRPGIKLPGFGRIGI